MGVLAIAYCHGIVYVFFLFRIFFGIFTATASPKIAKKNRDIKRRIVFNECATR